MRAAGAGVDLVVGLRDLRPRGSGAPTAMDRAPSRGGGGQVGGGLLLGFGGEVVAAEQADGDVVEQHRPEREVGAVVAGGVGGDDGLVLGDGGVEVDVVGEGHLDDAVDAVGGVAADRGGGVGPVEGDGVAEGRAGRPGRSAVRRTVPMTVAPPQCASCAAIDADAAENAVDQDGRPVTGPSANTARCAVMPGMPRHAPTSSLTVSGRSTAHAVGHDGVLGGGAGRPVGLGAPHPYPPADPAGSTPSPTASMTPAPSLCGTTRG